MSLTAKMLADQKVFPAWQASQPQPQLSDSIARALLSAIEEQAPVPAPMPKRTPDMFDSSEVPGISIEKYLRRLQAVFRCSEACFIGAIVVMDRYLDADVAGQEPRRLTALNVHRLYLACLVVTVKYNEDLVYGNSHYAKAGGIPLREVNRLERHLLMALDYDLRVQPEEISQYEEMLMQIGRTLPSFVVPEATCSSIEKRAAAAPVRSVCRPSVSASFQVKLVMQQ